MYKRIKNRISTKNNSNKTSANKKKETVNKHEKKINLLKQSEFFDAEYYLNENPDVEEDPYEHYLHKGFKEGRNPSFLFSNDFYLETHKDVAESGGNPLIHYILFGKKENRAIAKNLGKPLHEMYDSVYKYQYFFKVYFTKENNNRVNLFFDKIDESIHELANLFDFILTYCEKYNTSLRIIYYLANFEVLKDFLNKNNMRLPDDAVFLNLKRDNYLEVGLNEKYISSSWKSARCLLNTPNINSKVFFYVTDLDKFTNEEYFQISNTCYNENVVVLNDDSDNLKRLKKCNFNFDYNVDASREHENNKLFCDFENMFVEGAELIKYLVINGILDEKNSYTYLFSKNKLDFYLDYGINVKAIPKLNDKGLFLRISYDKTEITDNNNYINMYVEEITDDNYNSLDIEDDESLTVLNETDEFVQTKVKQNENLSLIKDIFNEFYKGN